MMAEESATPATSSILEDTQKLANAKDAKNKGRVKTNTQTTHNQTRHYLANLSTLLRSVTKNTRKMMSKIKSHKEMFIVLIFANGGLKNEFGNLGRCGFPAASERVHPAFIFRLLVGMLSTSF